MYPSQVETNTNHNTTCLTVNNYDYVKLTISNSLIKTIAYNK